MWFFLLLAIAVAAWLIYRRSQPDTGSDLFRTESRSPLDIAQKRYANGEITKEELQEIENTLN